MKLSEAYYPTRPLVPFIKPHRTEYWKFKRHIVDVDFVKPVVIVLQRRCRIPIMPLEVLSSTGHEEIS